ncbi:hypothetical protein [Nocardia brasiliensis]|uniref:hypothetical protein n=1 Tax=Nocardia brasiliensis TaxID=37326 RepID=UPI003671078B
MSRSTVPTEDELRAAAKELGIANADGSYDRSLRNRLARAVQLTKQEHARADDPGEHSTAWQLARFREDLAEHELASAADGLLIEAARHLLRSQGLRLESRKETTPS